MITLVADSSVAMKWFVPEVYEEEAQRLLAPEYKLIAPDFLFTEVGNVLWKR